MNWISDMNYIILILSLWSLLNFSLIIIDFIQFFESIILVNRISYLLIIISLFAVDTIREMKHSPFPTESTLHYVHIALHKVLF
jgi:hypothetical protein